VAAIASTPNGTGQWRSPLTASAIKPTLNGSDHCEWTLYHSCYGATMISPDTAHPLDTRPFASANGRLSHWTRSRTGSVEIGGMTIESQMVKDARCG
jgi:hypothetical protein